ncbi:MAG: hypothetical protein J5795_06140 [Lachnospiraceae bacterium]|nr:hypothetical protein [Lachnospiraceae bacterium]
MVGESNYAECVVKRKSRATDSLLKGLLVFGVLALGFFATITGGLLQLLALFLTIGMFFFAMYQWSRFNVEYEYIFVDGQIDFDAVYSGTSRKHLKRIDMEKTEVVAKPDSSALDGYKHLELKPTDYTSGADSDKVYAIIVKGEKCQEEILFEPDENFLQYMKKKSPRKVIL